MNQNMLMMLLSQGGMGLNQPQSGMTQNPQAMAAKPTYDISAGANAAKMGGAGVGKDGIQDGLGGAGAGAKSALKGASPWGQIAGLAGQSGLLPRGMSSGLSGASTGAQIGSLGGPVGTGIGAGVGGLAGLLGGKGGGGPNPRAANIPVSQIPMGGMGGM